MTKFFRAFLSFASQKKLGKNFCNMELSFACWIHLLWTRKWSNHLKISFCIKFQLFGICWRQGRARPGCLLSRPLAGLDAKRLNKQYHPEAVEEKRRDCVVYAKFVSVQNLSRGSKSRTNTVCVTRDQKLLSILLHHNCWEKRHNLVEYWR